MSRARGVLVALGLGLGALGCLPAASVAAPPQSLAVPVLDGPARVGATLKTTPGRWNQPLDLITVRWERCGPDGSACVDVTGATADRYLVGPQDAAGRLRSRVTVTRGGESAVARSAPSARIGPVAPALAASTAGTEAAFAFLGEEGARFECRLDDRASEPCTSPVRHTGLSVGAHRFVVGQIGADAARSPLAAFEWSVVPADAPATEVGAEEAPFEPPLDDPLPTTDPQTDFGTGAFAEFGPTIDDARGLPEGSAPDAAGFAGGPTRPATFNRIQLPSRFQRRLSTILDKGARLRLRCSILCNVTANLTLSARDARALGLRQERRLVVARRTRSGTGSLSLLLVPRPRAAAALRRTRRPLTLSLRVADGPEHRSARVILRP